MLDWILNTWDYLVAWKVWDNFWQVVGSGIGAAIGGYIAYKIAKSQNENNWELNIKSVFLERDINSCANGIKLTNELLNELNDLMLKIPTSESSKILVGRSSYEYESFEEGEVRLYEKYVTNFEKQLPHKKSELSSNLKELGINEKLRVDMAVNIHKGLVYYLKENTILKVSDYSEQSGMIMEQLSDIYTEVFELKRRIEEKLFELRKISTY